MRRTRFFLFVIMIVLGLVLGLIYGWILNPVKYDNTSPDMLRSDYKADFVLMVAQIYQKDGDLVQANRQLALLGKQPSDQIAADALVTARALSYAPTDLEQMEKLVQALKGKSTPIAGGQP